MGHQSFSGGLKPEDTTAIVTIRPQVGFSFDNVLSIFCIFLFVTQKTRVHKIYSSVHVAGSACYARACVDDVRAS
jgi:hypothetical protein